MRFLIANILLFLIFGLNGQNDFAELENELARYNDYFVNADNAMHRIYAHKQFKPLFEKVLKKDSSFYYPFDSVKWISKLMAKDSSFRIFSWQLDISGTKPEYYGYVQKRDGTVIELKDNKERFNDLEYEVFSSDDWYGQLYYNLYQYNNAGKNEYMLFGYKQLNNYDKIKIAAPVYFDDNTVYFGKEVFEDTLRAGGLKNRVTLKTIATAASKLNYDEEMEIIIYDHTIVIPLERPNYNGIPFVPDGSYHGYRLEGGKWMFIDKVFNQDYSGKSIPVRKKDGAKRDIMGKEYKR